MYAMDLCKTLRDVSELSHDCSVPSPSRKAGCEPEKKTKDQSLALHVFAVFCECLLFRFAHGV